MEKVKSQCKSPQNISIFAVDFSRPKEVLEKTNALMQVIEKDGKKIDIVILSVGVGLKSKFFDLDYSNHEYITNVNYNGPFAFTKAVIHHMIKNKNGQFVIMCS